MALAEARYRAAIVAPTPDEVVVATLAPQATTWAQYVADREETLHREPPDSERAWVARDELEQNGPQATAVAYQLDAALHPPGPDPLAVDVARALSGCHCYVNSCALAYNNGGGFSRRRGRPHACLRPRRWACYRSANCVGDGERGERRSRD